MAVVGSYVLSARDRDRAKGGPDPATAAARLLKLFGSQAHSLGELSSLTGWPQPTLRAVVEDLRQRELVEGEDDRLRLTALGVKAQFIVAT